MEHILPDRPLNYRQLIKASLILYKVSFVRILILSFLLSFTVFIPRILSIAIGEDLFFSLTPTGWYRVWLACIQVVSIIFFIGILWRMHCILINKKEPLVEDFSIAIHKIISVLVAGVIQSVILLLVALVIYFFQLLLHKEGLLFNNNLISTILTTLVFLLPFLFILYTVALFTFLIPLIAIENRNVFAAVRKSVLLAWNHWWRIFTVQATPWLTYLFVLILVRFAMNINIHIYYMDANPHHLLPTIINLILFTCFIPWVAALLLVQLNDLEIRNRLLPKAKK